MYRRRNLLVAVLLVLGLGFFRLMLVSSISRILEEEFALHLEFGILEIRGLAQIWNTVQKRTF
jgi:hypothetical protein